MVNILIQLCILMVMVTCVSAQVISFDMSFDISTIAGTDTMGYKGDGTLATEAQLKYPRDVAVNSLGEVFIADTNNHRIRKVLLNGTITTFAGTGSQGYNGDGILATTAQLNFPIGVAVNSWDEVFIADMYSHRIRKVLLNGTITTFAGNGTIGYNGDGILATEAQLKHPRGVEVNSLGEVFIADTSSHRIRKVLLDGTITTIAGTGSQGYNGDGILATTAQLNIPIGVAVNSLGEVFIADINNLRIRKVLLNGTITTFAGTGVAGYNGDGIMATSATLYSPQSVCLNSLGEVLIVDQSNHRIRKVLLDGTITTLAGTDDSGYNGDGILATSSTLNSPNGVAVNSLGEVIVGDTYNHRIRKIIDCPPNSIKNGTQCHCFDGYYGYGQYCDKFNCNNIVNDRSDVCSSNGQCVSPNNCKCNPGYYGANCEVYSCNYTLYNDSNVCSGYGKCTAPNNCTCNNGYYGVSCELHSCNNTLFNDTSVCSGFGQCIAPNNCTCKTGYYGTGCELFDCYGIPKINSSVCSGSGQCSGINNCTCNTGYFGGTCELFDCFGTPNTNSRVCSGSGQCSGLNTCKCNAGYSGSNCEIYSCNNNLFNDTKVCSSLGQCIAPNNCKCNNGYYGNNCELFDCYGIPYNNVTGVCSGRGTCIGINNCTCTNVNYGGGDCSIPKCFGILASNSSAVCSGRGICSSVDTCNCQNSGFVGKQCSLYNIGSALSVSFNSTQDYIGESSTTVRVVINNAQYATFYKTRSVTARFTFTIDSSSSTIVINVVFPAAGNSSPLEATVPPFTIVGKVSVSVQLSDTDSGVVISDNQQSTNTLNIVNRSRVGSAVVVGSASQSSFNFISLLICLVITLVRFV